MSFLLCLFICKVEALQVWEIESLTIAIALWQVDFIHFIWQRGSHEPSHCLFILTCDRSFQCVLAAAVNYDPPDLRYLGAALANDTSNDFIWNCHLVGLMSAGSPSSTSSQCSQSYNHKQCLHLLCIDKNDLCLVHFSVLVLPAGERTPGPNPFNPFNPLMLFRPPPAWGSNPPFPNCKQICIVDWWVADN